MIVHLNHCGSDGTAAYRTSLQLPARLLLAACGQESFFGPVGSGSSAGKHGAFHG